MVAFLEAALRVFRDEGAGGGLGGAGRNEEHH